MVSGTSISVGAPFFNKVNIPIGLLLLFLTGVGPLLAWRKTSVDSLRRNFGWPLMIGGCGGVVAFALGYREFYSLLCLVLCVFVTSTILHGILSRRKVIRARTGSIVAVGPRARPCATRGAMAATLCTLAWCWCSSDSRAWRLIKTRRRTCSTGADHEIGPYTLLLQSTDTKAQKNYTAERMTIEVLTATTKN